MRWASASPASSAALSDTRWQKARAWAQPMGRTAKRGKTRASRPTSGRPGCAGPSARRATGGSEKKGRRSKGRPMA
eukprot:1802312-Lingulodinium_polyedra.AAC.2